MEPPSNITVTITITFSFESKLYQIIVNKGINFLDLRDKIANGLKIHPKGVTILNSEGQDFIGDKKAMKFEQDQKVVAVRRTKEKKNYPKKNYPKREFPKKDYPKKEFSKFGGNDHPTKNQKILIDYRFKEKQNKFLLPVSELHSNNIKYEIAQIENVSQHSLQLFDKHTGQEIPPQPTMEYITNLGVIIVKVDPNFQPLPHNISNEKPVKEEFKNLPGTTMSYHHSSNYHGYNQSVSEKLYLKVKYGNEELTMRVKADGTVKDLINITKSVFKIPKEQYINMLDNNRHKLNSNDELSMLEKNITFEAKIHEKNKQKISIKIQIPNNQILEFTMKESEKISNLKREICHHIHFTPRDFELYYQNDQMIHWQTSLKGFNNNLLKLKYVQGNIALNSPSSNSNIKGENVSPNSFYQSELIKMMAQLMVETMQLKDNNKSLTSSTLMKANIPIETPKPAIETSSTIIQNKGSKEEKLKEINSRIKEINDNLEKNFQCPICQCIFKEPVLARDSFVYDRNCINQWFANHDTSPFTRAKFESKEVIPVVLVRTQISDLKEELEKLEKMKRELT